MIDRRLRYLMSLFAVATTASACAPPAHIGGVPSAAPTPSAEWVSQKATGAGAAFNSDESQTAMRGSYIPSEVSTRMDRLTIGDVVDLALGNSPQTRTTWAQARAAAAVYGSSRGALMPLVTAEGIGGPQKSVATLPPQRSTFTTSLNLSYVLLDF